IENNHITNHVYIVHFDIPSSRCQHEGMTQARDAYHHGDLRNALVASAVRLIEASGLSGSGLAFCPLPS
ncbi:MAG: hypothetical protein ACK520_12340, partial [Inhella sp.]